MGDQLDIQRPDFKYGGVLGTTHKRSVHIRCRCGEAFRAEVFQTVNAQTDPELANALRANVETLCYVLCHCCGDELFVAVSVVYHDPQRGLFVLVMPESQRHLEVQERALLMAAIAEETSIAVPNYVLTFPIVFSRELADYLDASVHAFSAHASSEKPTTDVLSPRELQEQDPDDIHVFEDDADFDIDSAVPEPVSGQITQPSPDSTQMPAHVDHASAVHVMHEEEGDIPVEVVSGQVSSPLVTGLDTAGLDTAGLDTRTSSAEPDDLNVNNAAYVDEGKVKLRARVDAVGLGCLLQELCVCIQMHPLPSYPLVTLTLSGPERISPIVFPLDIGVPEGRAIVAQLARDFSFLLELFDTDFSPTYASTITAPLTANARYLLPASDAHLIQIAEDQRSCALAWAAYSDPLYDRWGVRNRYSHKFDERKLCALGSATEVVAALDTVRMFTDPEAEQFLILIRGFPMQRWVALRRAVLVRAFEFGLWPGSELVHVALSEGIAASRSSLIETLHRNFAMLCEGGVRLNGRLIADNWQALKEQSIGQHMPNGHTYSVPIRPEGFDVSLSTSRKVP